MRGYQVGGKSLISGRACARWSPKDFESPKRLGYGIPWPTGYDDVAPWYSHVEKYIGVCATHEGIATLPDGEYLPAMRCRITARTCGSATSGCAS